MDGDLGTAEKIFPTIPEALRLKVAKFLEIMNRSWDDFLAYSERAALDLFADYLYQTIQFEDSVQVGGFKMGGGLGVSF